MLKSITLDIFQISYLDSIFLFTSHRSISFFFLLLFDSCIHFKWQSLYISHVNRHSVKVKIRLISKIAHGSSWNVENPMASRLNTIHCNRLDLHSVCVMLVYFSFGYNSMYYMYTSCGGRYNKIRRHTFVIFHRTFRIDLFTLTCVLRTFSINLCNHSHLPHIYTQNI